MLIKRIFDVLFTLPGLILLLPVFLVITVWIKLDTPGTIFFRQIRVGKSGKLFSIYKFRTMITDEKLPGKQITVGNDKRITKSGRILRKYKLDELPQLFNVLKGDMSLVGPRPEVPKYIAKYPEQSKQIVLSVLPGITDFASIEFMDENFILTQAEDPEQVYVNKVLPIKINYYIRYVKERSIWVDFLIILKTVYNILFGSRIVADKKEYQVS